MFTAGASFGINSSLIILSLFSTCAVCMICLIIDWMIFVCTDAVTWQAFSLSEILSLNSINRLLIQELQQNKPSYVQIVKIWWIFPWTRRRNVTCLSTMPELWNVERCTHRSVDAAMHDASGSRMLIKIWFCFIIDVCLSQYVACACLWMELIQHCQNYYCHHLHDQDGIELQLGTNHMGPYLLSHLLRPQLKRSGEGRWFNFSSKDGLSSDS